MNKQFLKFLAVCVCVCGGTAGAFAMRIDSSGFITYQIGLLTGLIMAGILEK